MEVNRDRAVEVATEAFRAHGVSDADARQTAEVLVSADAMGKHSHGLLRLPRFVQGIEHGNVDPHGAIDIVDTLDGYSPELLRHVAGYAEELAEYHEREARLAEEDSEDEVEERLDDLPNGVPSKATITIKEINDNRYYYWQWREGDKIRSQYKAPVTRDE
jgi:hypothetical protein